MEEKEIRKVLTEVYVELADLILKKLKESESNIDCAELATLIHELRETAKVARIESYW